MSAMLFYKVLTQKSNTMKIVILILNLVWQIFNKLSWLLFSISISLAIKILLFNLETQVLSTTVVDLNPRVYHNSVYTLQLLYCRPWSLVIEVHWENFNFLQLLCPSAFSATILMKKTMVPLTDICLSYHLQSSRCLMTCLCKLRVHVDPV